VAPFDPVAVRARFPALAAERRGRPLAYLDSAATAAKPDLVLDELRRAYVEAFANVHRAVHGPSEVATERYEAARARVARFLGAAAPDEVVFARGTTEALNLVVGTLGRVRVGPGDEVVVTALDHHASFVPWQQHCRSVGATLRVVPFDPDGRLVLAELDRALGPRTRIVAVPHASNALGTVIPVAEVARRAHAAGALVVVDGAQAAPHLPVDVRALGVDAYAFSGHKVYGPQGIGALWMRAELWEDLPPWQTGGEMVLTVELAETTFQRGPHRYEAGTPHAVGAMALGAALDFVEGLGWDALAAHESALASRARRELTALPGVRAVGPGDGVPLVSFVVDGVHPHDLGTLLDQEGIAVRTGHHCAMPAMDALGLPGTTRASFAAYNTEGEVDRLVRAVDAAKRRLG
jgi:cysteine desulfurase/selenocysteine lyase